MYDSTRPSEPYPVGLLFIALLPMMMFWRCYSVFAGELGVQATWQFIDYAQCFVQDVAVLSVFYVLCSWLSRHGASAAKTVAIIFVANLLLVLQIIDARTKLKFLEPLSWDLIVFSLTETATLASGVFIFAGVNFWKVALMFSLTFFLISLLLVAVQALRSNDSLGRMSALVIRWIPRRPVPAAFSALVIVVSVAAGAYNSPKAYGLHSNFIFSSLAQPLLQQETPGHRNHQQFKTPQPLRLSSADDFAHVTNPSVAVAKGYNVVLYVLESTPSWVIREAESRTGSSVFAELAAQGGHYSDSYSSFATSTKSMFTLLSGIYASPTSEVIAANVRNLPGLPNTLRELGYHTEFVSSQGLHYQGERDIYDSIGYDVVKGLPELLSIAESRGLDVDKPGFSEGNDRLMFVEGVQRLKDMQPFFATFYSSAAHLPYKYPGSTAGSDEERHQRAVDYSQVVVREMLEELKVSGLLEQTIIVITSDHGEEFIDGKFSGRGTNLSQQTHMVPLVIHVPDKNIGVPEYAFTRHIDLLPTILDLLGIAPEGEPMQGHSMMKPNLPRDAYLMSSGRIRRAATIIGREKTVHSFDTDESFIGTLGNDMNEPAYEKIGFSGEVNALRDFSIYNEAVLRDMSEEKACISPLVSCDKFTTQDSMVIGG